MAMIIPHATGHQRLPDGGIVRVDTWRDHRGLHWVASRYTPQMCEHDHVVGSDEHVHQVAQQWIATS